MKLLIPLIVALLLFTGNVNANKNKKELKIAMAHCCIEKDVFMWNVAHEILDAAKEDGQQIEFISADGDQDKQLQIVQQLIDEKVDAILMSIIVDGTIEKPFQQKMIAMLEESNIPIVFYLLPFDEKYFEEYKNGYYVGSIPAQSGIYQGELIVETWKNNPQFDKNNDGVIQYAILKGPNGNPDAEERTKWVKATIEHYPTQGVKAEQLDLKVAKFVRQNARVEVQKWFDSKLIEQLEVIIANNDDMALGAIDVMKENNFFVPIFGVDALPEAIELIKEGKMMGTVLQDISLQARSAYQLAKNLAQKSALDRDISEVIVERRLMIPYVAIDSSNIEKY